MWVSAHASKFLFTNLVMLPDTLINQAINSNSNVVIIIIKLNLSIGMAISKNPNNLPNKTSQPKRKWDIATKKIDLCMLRE